MHTALFVSFSLKRDTHGESGYGLERVQTCMLSQIGHSSDPCLSESPCFPSKRPFSFQTFVPHPHLPGEVIKLAFLEYICISTIVTISFVSFSLNTNISCNYYFSLIFLNTAAFKLSLLKNSGCFKYSMIQALEKSLTKSRRGGSSKFLL